MSDEVFEYPASDLQDAPSTNELTELSSLANELYLAELALSEASEKLKEAKAKVDGIAEHQIPELMDKIGLAEFTTTSGIKLQIKDVLRTSIPAARRPEAYQWLEEQGFGELIKRNVVVGFGRRDDDAAAELMKDLDARGLRIKDEMKVEPQTLKKWVKDRLGQGQAVPMDLFGVRQFKQAKIEAKPETAFGD